MTDTPAPRPPLPLLLLLGALSIALGVAALAWPQATLLTLALLFGVHLVLVGGLRLWVAWRGHELPRTLRWFVGVLGLAVLALGVVTIANPAGQLTLLAYLIGIAWIIDGVAALFGGMPDAAIVPRALAIATCVLSIVAGILVLAMPGAALATVLIVGAVFLIVAGLLLVLVGVVARRAAR